MHTTFGHQLPTVPKVPLPPSPPGNDSTTSSASAALDATIVAAIFGILWLLSAHLMRDRMDWLVWPAGITIGIAAMRSAGRGSLRLGLWCALLTFLVLLAVAIPATAAVFYRGRVPIPWHDVWDSTRDGLTGTNNLFWVFLGLMSAYRFASRRHVRPPGL
jgi:hypothetical protein